MYAKAILYFGKPHVLACDGNCLKAWGMSSRPKVQLSSDPDDYVYRRDGELLFAPEDPGTYEGGFGKPTGPDDYLNKWCARECERSRIGEQNELVTLRDFSKPVYNQPSKHAADALTPPTTE